MRFSSAAGILALSIAMAQQASAATITYTVNDTVGAGGVTGTIVTDGTIGSLSDADFLSFSLTLNDGTGIATLTNAEGVVVIGGPDNVTATATALLFDFNSNGGFLNFFNEATCSPAEWSFETAGSGSACNGTTGDAEGVSAVLPPGAGTYSVESGPTVFATMSATGVTPEPSSLLLLGTGFAGLFGVARRRSS